MYLESYFSFKITEDPKRLLQGSHATVWPSGTATLPLAVVRVIVAYTK